MNVLEEAASLINGDRQEQYGNATESFDRIADMWGAYLNTNMTGLDVVNLMVLLKVSRTKQAYHRDSYVDIAGYAALGERLYQESELELTVAPEPRVWDDLYDVPKSVKVMSAGGFRWKFWKPGELHENGSVPTSAGEWLHSGGPDKYSMNYEGYKSAPFTEVLETT